MPYFIGIDIGTGSTKALALDESCNKILTSKQVSYPTLYPAFHFVEQDPEVIWKAFVDCIKQCIAEQGELPLSIGISSAMHSLIPVNEQGVPLMNMITWADGRSADIADVIKQSSEGTALYTSTGTPIHAMSPLCKIIWLKDHSPDVYHQTKKFISIKEYIWHKLFHDYEVDYSIASGSGLFHIQDLCWNQQSLSLAGIKEDQLSHLVSTGYSRSDINKDIASMFGVDSILSFTIGGSDGCLANLGSHAITPGVASLTIGTSGAIRVTSKVPCYNYNSMTFSYRLDENLFICGGPINNGGAVWKWYVNDLLKKENSSGSAYGELLTKASMIPAGSQGLIFLPYLLGERAPIWNSKSCGVFFGVTQEHHQDHFTRAVIEGISLALHSVGKALEDASGEIDHILVSGGFVQSSLWLQIIADVFNKNVIRQNTEDASAIGAAIMAIRSFYKMDHYPIFESSESTQIIAPSETAHKTYSRIAPLFQRLYEKLKDEMDFVYQFNDTENLTSL